MVTSVRMSLLRSRFRLSRTSLAWRVNWMQLSAAQDILSKSVTKQSNEFVSSHIPTGKRKNTIKHGLYIISTHEIDNKTYRDRLEYAQSSAHH